MNYQEKRILERAKQFAPNHLDKPMKCYSYWQTKTIEGNFIVKCKTCGVEFGEGDKPNCGMYKRTPSNTLLHYVLIGFVVALVSIIGSLYFYEWLQR